MTTPVPCNFCDNTIDLSYEDTCSKCGKSHFLEPGSWDDIYESYKGVSDLVDFVSWLSENYRPAVPLKEIRGSDVGPRLADVVGSIADNLKKQSVNIKYLNGDVSDLGNEIGYCVGGVVKNMTEREVVDFIHGIRHGISLTNNTH